MPKNSTQRISAANKGSDEPPQLSLLRMAQMRKQIDAIDNELSTLLLRRLEIAAVLGNLKQELGMPVKDPERETVVLEKVRAKLTSSDLAEHVQRIYHAILNEACKVQDESILR